MYRYTGIRNTGMPVRNIPAASRGNTAAGGGAHERAARRPSAPAAAGVGAAEVGVPEARVRFRLSLV